MEVVALHWDGESISQRLLPALPQPRAFASGAVAGNTPFIGGGLETPNDSIASGDFWALDLADPDAQWQNLESLPGLPGHIAVSGPQKRISISSAVSPWSYIFRLGRLRVSPQHLPVSPSLWLGTTA